MADETKAELKKGDKVVNIFKRVAIIATKENPYIEEGKEFKAQENIAEYLIKKGYAKKK